MRLRSLRSFSVVLVVLLGLLIPGSVGAQARLLSSDPADGDSVLDLDVMNFEFDTLLRPDDAAVTVLRTDGTEIPVAAVVVDGSTLSARIDEVVPSGNYVISYSVEGSDARLNEGSLRVSIDSPSQELSGGLLAVLAIAAGMFTLLAVVFIADKRRRPSR